MCNFIAQNVQILLGYHRHLFAWSSIMWWRWSWYEGVTSNHFAPDEVTPFQCKRL